MNRSGSSVRLRSSLGKMDTSDSNTISTSASSTTDAKVSRRRAAINNSNINSGNNNGHQLLNGNSAATSVTSTRSHSRTRGGNGVNSSFTGMEIDADEHSGGDGGYKYTGSLSTAGPGPPADQETVESMSDNSTQHVNSTFSANANNTVCAPSNNDTNDNDKEVTDMTMEVDQEDASSSDSSSSDSSDSSDSEDSSEMDEETSERKRIDYQDNVNDLEKQFNYLRELLYKERLLQAETKLEEIRSGRAKEYLSPLEALQGDMRIRIEVAGKLKEYRLINMNNKFEAEELAARQNFESERSMLYDAIKADLEDKIHRLEEDRNNDFTSELWLEAALKRKNKKSVDIFGEKRKKPVTVSGPYVVYMLNDVDIVEDWTILKKAMSAPKRKYVDMVF